MPDSTPSMSTPNPTSVSTPDPTSMASASSSPSSSFLNNLNQAQQALSNPENSENDESKKEEKDPMVDYGEQLMKLVEMLSKGPDTATDPMSMMNDSGADDDLNDFDAKASANNDPVSANTNEQEVEQVSNITMGM